MISFKNLVHAQRSHEETIKYVQDIIDRSWETIKMMDETEEGKESIMLVEKKDKQVEEVNMLSDKIDEPLLDLDKCSLHELNSIFKSLLMIPLLMFMKQDLDHT